MVLILWFPNPQLQKEKVKVSAASSKKTNLIQSGYWNILESMSNNMSPNHFFSTSAQDSRYMLVTWSWIDDLWYLVNVINLPCSCALPHRGHLLWVVTVIVRPRWLTLWPSIMMPVRWSYVRPHQRQRLQMSPAWVTLPPPATRNPMRVTVSVGLQPVCFFIFINVQKCG